MKRDMNVCRELLRLIEAADHGQGPRPSDGLIPGHSKQDIAYQMILLKDAGLIEGADAATRGGLVFIPTRLTWSGHEFLDAARNDTIWNKARTKLGSEFRTTSFTVLQSLLASLGKEALGLPM